MTTALERARKRWGSAMLVTQTGPTAADDAAQLLGLQEHLRQDCEPSINGWLPTPADLRHQVLGSAAYDIPEGGTFTVNFSSPNWANHPDLGGTS